MELVEVNRNEVYCDSHLVAKKFGLKNNYVANRIKKVIKDLNGIREHGVTPKCYTEERTYRGNSYTAYLMNRDFFSFLVMRFKGKKAIKWQLEFIAAFNLMEKRLLLADANAADPEFLKVRNQGKIARRQETDVIQSFVEYATKQGSKSAKYYYKHITNSCYRALGLLVQKKPKLRDTMNIMELAELQLMENRARILLKKYMDLGREYHDIYNSVNKDLVNFGKDLHMEKVESTAAQLPPQIEE